MFGIAFFLLSKTIMHVQLKRSIIMAGIGLILLFGARTSSLVIMATYPPWGVISMTFLITGSYSILVGLDSALLSGNRFFIAKNNCNFVTKGRMIF